MKKSFIIIICMQFILTSFAQDLRTENLSKFEQFAYTGIELYSQEKYDEALPYLLYCCHAFENQEDHDIKEYLDFIQAIANCYTQMGEYSLVIEWRLKFIEKQKDSNDVNNNYYNYLLLAQAYQNLNYYENAVKYYKEAANIAKGNRGRNSSAYADVLSILSKVYYENQELRKAIKFEKEALKIREKNIGEGNDDYWTSISNLSVYYHARRDLNSAIHLARQVASNYNLNYSEQQVIALNNLATIISEKDLIIARDIILQSINILRKLEFKEDLSWTVFCNLSEIYYKLNDFDNAAQTMSEALAFVQENIINKWISLSNTGQYSNWDKYWLYFCRVFPFIISKCTNDDFNGELYNKSVLFPKLLAYSSKWKNKDSCLLNNYKNITWKTIQGKLQGDEAAIEFLSFAKDDSINYYALILRKDYTRPKLVRIATEKALNYSSFPNYNSIIWEPLFPYLDGVHSIYFSPVGVLEIMSFDNPIICGKDFKTYRLSSTAMLLDTIRVDNKECTAALWGGLFYTNNSTKNSFNSRSGFDYLPNTLPEIQDINSSLSMKGYKVSIYSEDNGTENNFKELSGKIVNIIHFASHAIYVKEVEMEQFRKEKNYSFILKNNIGITSLQMNLSSVGLVMSNGNVLPYRESALDEDGILTGCEIENIDLHNTDMVVLSACNTGRGNFSMENIAGLSMAFKRAGANTIVMSLGNVDDEATRILMVEFYKNLMSGKTKLQSLKDAQKNLQEIDNGKYNDPKYWASFIMLDGLN